MNLVLYISVYLGLLYFLLAVFCSCLIHLSSHLFLGIWCFLILLQIIYILKIVSPDHMLYHLFIICCIIINCITLTNNIYSKNCITCSSYVHYSPKNIKLKFYKRKYIPNPVTQTSLHFSSM